MGHKENGEMKTLRDHLTRLEQVGTKHGHLEEELKESEGKLNDMLEAIGDHMSMMDKDLNVIWANKTAKKMFGNDIIGKKCYEVYHRAKEPCKPFPCLTLKAFQDGGIHEHDTQVIDKNGGIIWFHCTANVTLRDREGKPTAVLEISRNITEGKLREEQLRQSEQRYRRLFEFSNDAIFIAYVETGMILDANYKAQELLGYSLEELRKMHHSELHPQEEIERYKSLLNRSVEPERSTFEPLHVIHKDGRWIPVEISASAFQVEGKSLIQGIFRDITEHKKAEEALRQSHEYYKSLIENNSDIIIVLNRDQTRRYVSPAIERALGYKPEELVDRKPIQLAHPDDLPEAIRLFDYTIQNPGCTTSMKLRLRHKDGTWRYFEVVGENLLDDPAVKGIVTNLRDITERKKAEAKLLESEEMARALLNAPTDSILMIDAKGTILDANETFINRFGGHSDKILGSCVYDMFTSDVAKYRKAQVDEVFRSSKPIRFEDMREGIWFDSVIYPVFNGVKEVTKVAIVARDITEHKKAEKEIKERIKELERFSELTVNRELRMVELKKEIQELKKEIERLKAEAKF